MIEAKVISVTIKQHQYEYVKKNLLTPSRLLQKAIQDIIDREIKEEKIIEEKKNEPMVTPFPPLDLEEEWDGTIA